MFRTPRNAPLAGVSPQKAKVENPQIRALRRSPRNRQCLGLGKLGLTMLWAFVMLPVAAHAQHDVSKFDPVDHYGSRLLAVLIVIGFALSFIASFATVATPPGRSLGVFWFWVRASFLCLSPAPEACWSSRNRSAWACATPAI